MYTLILTAIVFAIVCFFIVRKLKKSGVSNGYTFVCAYAAVFYILTTAILTSTIRPSTKSYTNSYKLETVNDKYVIGLQDEYVISVYGEIIKLPAKDTKIVFGDGPNLLIRTEEVSRSFLISWSIPIPNSYSYMLVLNTCAIKN